MFSRLRQKLLGHDAPPALASPFVRDFFLPEGVRVYAIGDIHGRAQLLKKMLAAIEADVLDNPPARIIEIFLGDYIDRGLHSREVLEVLDAPPPKGRERIFLMGNHEETLLKFLREPGVLRDWGNYGGYGTLASYGISIPSAMTPEKLSELRDAFLKNFPPEHLKFLQGLRLFTVQGDYLFVHAGIVPYVPVGQQKQEHMLWIRGPFLNHEDYFEQYVVHGHSPVKAPDIRENRANLDVSEAATESLACLVIEGSTRRIILMTDENN